MEGLRADGLQVREECFVAAEAPRQLVLEEEPRQGDHQSGLGGDKCLRDPAGDHVHRLTSAAPVREGAERREHARYRPEEPH